GSGDRCVTDSGPRAGPPGQWFAWADADVIVRGARPGAIDGATAGSLPGGVKVVAPAANVPYTRQGADVLRQRGIMALPDFVCNAGAVIGYRSPRDATPADVLSDTEDMIAAMIDDALGHEAGPLAGACERAGAFLRPWWGEPPAPPFAGS